MRDAMFCACCGSRARTAPWSVRTSDARSRSSSTGATPITGSSPFSVLIRPADRPADGSADRLVDRVGILRDRRRIRDRLEDRRQIAHRHALAQQLPQDALNLAERHELRHEVFDQPRRRLRNLVHHFLDLLTTQEVRQERSNGLRQMRRERGGRINHGVAGGRCRLALVLRNPCRGKTERRLLASACLRSLS